jgi:hypothetical protein
MPAYARLATAIDSDVSDAPRAHLSAAAIFLFLVAIRLETCTPQRGRRTRHTGLRASANNGLLKAAYNLTNIVEGREGAAKAFDDFVNQLCRNL